VDVGQNEWQNIYSGRIDEDGSLNLPFKTSIPNGTYTVLLYQLGTYQPGSTGTSVVTLTVTFSNGAATGGAFNAYKGYLFVLGNTVKQKRIFRVLEVQMDEEGEVTVRAMEHPCDAGGSLLTKFDGFTVS